MKHRVTKFLAWLKGEVLRAEVVVKTALATVIGGGVTAVADIYHSGKTFELTTAHFLELKAKFLSGAAIALVMYLARSPIGKPAK